MVGLLIEIIISWILLWFFDKKNLSVLGISPTKGRSGNFLSGFFAAAICCAIYCLSLAALTNNTWTANTTFTQKDFAISTWWTLRSVLFEELIFRGALLYIAIQMLGDRKACILSAFAFGVYHWFSYSAFGNPIQMITIFLMTGIWGLMFAFAFAKTRSLYLPIGLHFGWNLMNIVIFSNGPLGNQLLINTNATKLEGILSLFVLLFQVFTLPVFVYIYLINKQKMLQKDI
jgi:membrane protease YdiL (CAAX protease family)